ncbi:MAG: leucine-rich repeat domain-containing protein, partial [Eggerthia catenaformis]
HEMKQLRYFNFLAGILKSEDYTPILSLERIEHLTLKPCKEVKALYNDMIQLPRLKYGLLVDKPELYRK